MTENDWQEIDSRINSITNFVGAHFSGLKQQIAHQPTIPASELKALGEKLDVIIELLQKRS